jgi:hypothetical protein
MQTPAEQKCMKSVSARKTPARPMSTAAALPAAGKKVLKTVATEPKQAYKEVKRQTQQ